MGVLRLFQPNWPDVAHVWIAGNGKRVDMLCDVILEKGCAACSQHTIYTRR